MRAPVRTLDVLLLAGGAVCLVLWNRFAAPPTSSEPAAPAAPAMNAPAAWRGSSEIPGALAAKAHESVREAIATKASPERLTALAEPAPFDRAAFEADPDKYLGTVEPGRCFQTKEAAGPEDVHLTMASKPRATIRPGEKAVLMVQGAPGAPVTFTSFDGGLFEENRLGSVTVRADARGYAFVHYTAGPGIVGDIQIQAGSPMAVGAQTFLVRVHR